MILYRDFYVNFLYRYLTFLLKKVIMYVDSPGFPNGIPRKKNINQEDNYEL